VGKGSRRSARRAEALAALQAGDDGPARPPAGERVEQHPDGDWVVRRIAGAGAGAPYRCPGCDQELRRATPHVVAWPEGRPDDRRHWHSPCWDARDRRTVKVHRSKNAPRFG
jgi:hypothetical protein